jgi:hypothetical protein
LVEPEGNQYPRGSRKVVEEADTKRQKLTGRDVFGQPKIKSQRRRTLKRPNLKRGRETRALRRNLEVEKQP